MHKSSKIQVEKILLRDHIYFNLAVFCFWFSVYIYIPLFGVYLEHTGFTYSAIGFILGGYGVTQILFRFPLGVLSDILYKIRKHLLIGGFIFSFLGAIILIYFDSFIMIMIARLFAGVTSSMWVMATVLYSYYFSPSETKKAMGIMQFNTVFTQFICMSISGYLIYLFGWKFPFWLGAIASLLGIYFVLKIKEVKMEPTTRKKFSVRQYITQTNAIANLKMLTFLSFMVHAVLFITIFGFSPIIAYSIGITEQQIAWLMVAFFIPHSVASLCLIFIQIDSRHTKGLLIASFGLTAFFLGLITIAESLVSMSLYHAGLGLALGIVFPLLLSEVVEVSPGHLKMSAMGFYQSLYAIGIVLGPVVAGEIADRFSLNEVFLVTGGVVLISMITLAFWKNVKKTSNAIENP